MTPEERAVIEAAEHWVDRGGCKRLCEALDALRESRKPKPRWEKWEFGIRDARSNTFYPLDNFGGRGLLLDVLNAYERGERP